MASILRIAGPIAIILVQASLCFAARVRVDHLTKGHAKEGANRTANKVVGTRASELTSRCDRRAFKLYCTRLPDDCSKALCMDCSECLRTNQGGHNLRRSGEYKSPVWKVPAHCNHLWQRGAEIDRGNYGLIQKVRESGEDFGKYVLKVALSANERAELESEVKIMSQIKCPGILPVVDPAPCNEAGAIIQGGFVMPEMVPNLWKWYDTYSFAKLQCRDTIQRQLSDALKCLHESNFIHGDFKGDQVLYKSLDSKNCPVGLEISDFGLSNPRTNTSGRDNYDYKYSGEYYSISGHLVGEMFSDDQAVRQYSPANPLALSHATDIRKYRISSTIDWCSFLLEMMTELALGDDDWFNSLSIPTNLAGLDCGWMSGRRNIRIIAGHAGDGF